MEKTSTNSLAFIPQKELKLRHDAVLPSWISLFYDDPIAIVTGEGRTVQDAEGKEYLDFFAGILTNMVGYNIPEINDPCVAQAQNIVHTSTLYLIPQMVELAEELSALSGIENAKVFFTSSGSEANDAALLLASAYRKSSQIFAMRNSYHGRTFSTMPITGNRNWSPSALSPFSVTYVHGSYKLRSPMQDSSPEEYIEFAKNDVADLIGIATSGDVAAIIAEPIQGVGGFATPPDGMFAAIKSETDKNGMLWISDEVQTAWGRTGENFWGYQAHGITPDIITFAKGLGNGYAIGGVIARPEIMDCLQSNSISTFGGNPLSATAALATLKYLKEHNLQDNALHRGSYIRERLNNLKAKHSFIAEVRGKGLMQGIELVESDGISPSVSLAQKIMEETKARGLLIGKGGLHGNCLRIAPPLSVTQEECEEAMNILEFAFGEVSK